MRRAVLATIVVLTAPAGTAAAAPAEFYTSPTGSGGACTQAAPCDFGQAVSAAADGDTVIVGSGEYGGPTGLPFSLFSAADITIRGASTTDKPRILLFSAFNGIQLTGKVTLRDLEIRNLSPAAGATALAVPNREAVLSRVIVSSAGRTAGSTVGTAVLASPSVTILDSVLIATSGNTSNQSGGNALRLLSGGSGGAGTLRNVTLDTPTGSNGFAIKAEAVTGGQWLTTVTNTIVGGKLDVAGTTNNPIQLDVASSRLRSEPTTGSNATVSKTNVSTAAPVFVDAAARDYRQAPTSAATIDQGAASSSETDLDGDPRTIGGRPDIGADEIPALPTAVLNGTADVTATSANVLGTASGGGGAATWKIEYGTTGFDLVFPQSFVLPRSTAAGPVSGQLTGLTTGAAYQARLVVTNDRGTTTSSPLTFTPSAAAPTTPTPSPTPGPSAAPTAAAVPTLQLTAPPRRPFKRGGSAFTASPGTGSTTITLAASQAGTLRITLERLQAGRRAGKRCSPSARSGAKCTIRRSIAGAETVAVQAGGVRLGFGGRFAGRKLAAGAYTARIALTAPGGTSAPVTVPLRLR